ncbi:MAG TPA: ATP-binding protein [Steroidobacteraceae bacterium]|jgi:signal transduction histidine kinase|nr:ATP-binding protein [Steroidobacteraceae bacterium]
MRHSLLELELANDRDMIAARQRARQVSALLDFDAQDQVRIATAVSEVARNAVRHGGGGRIEFALEEESGRNPALSIAVADQGPGIPDFEIAVGGTTATGEPKLGLVTARRLMDEFEIQSAPKRGTSITLRKHVPRRAEPFTRARIEALGRAVAANRTSDASAEIQQQNRDLLKSLEELRLRQEDLTRLNAELEDTNRGVMALYSELDERAAHLRAADETKTRFLSSVSHEFRTPVNSILALSKILLHRLDGELTSEQERQVRYIVQAAEQLATLIDDLLDLRKVEAGKIQLRAETFTVTDLFAALRGMFKPLFVNDAVALVIDEPADLPELYTDQGKVAQILRNLVSNALKFTQRGSVRVSCRLSQDGQLILFEVVDTGIGIAPENHRRIFDEFSQVENPLQTSVKGTGLGLPLSQRLAGLLGGGIEIRSALGQGSTFTLAIPVRVDGERGAMPLLSSEPATPMALDRVLIIDDNEIERYALRQFLSTSRYEVIEATGGYEGLRLARQAHPDVIFLDLMMPDVHGFEVLKMLKAIEDTRRIPVVVFTSQRLESAEERERAAGADALLMKSDLSRDTVIDTMHRVCGVTETDHARNT